MNKTYNILLICALPLLTACAESFPSILDENVQVRPDEVIAQEQEADLSPIMPTLNSPQFSFVTRGQGAFEAWDEDGRDAAETQRVRDAWQNADFRVFAYQTTNRNLLTGEGQGNVNLSETDDHQDEGKAGAANASGLCLLYNRVMHVTDPYQGRVRFIGADGEEQTYYYRITNQDRKYNFFTYYADDAVQNPQLTSTYKSERYTQVDAEGKEHQRQQLTCPVRIDGSQDIMHAFAYHTRQKFEDRVSELKDIQHLPKDQLNVLTSPDSYNQILYSTATGHRSINPIFQIRHLLSRFNVQVKGVNPSEHDEGDDSDFRNLIITKVSFKSPSTGTLTIAKDEWGDPVSEGNIGDSYEREVKDGAIIRWDGVTSRLLENGRTALSLGQNMGSKLYAPVITDKDTPDGAALYATIPLSDPTGICQRFWKEETPFHVIETNPVLLTRSILLPPMESFGIELEVYYLNYTDKDGSRHLNPDSPLLSYVIPATIKLSAEPFVFEAGSEYTINIYVYGLQHISVEAVFGSPWKHGGTITVDEDKLEDNAIVSN